MNKIIIEIMEKLRNARNFYISLTTNFVTKMTFECPYEFLVISSNNFHHSNEDNGTNCRKFNGVCKQVTRI